MCSLSKINTTYNYAFIPINPLGESWVPFTPGVNIKRIAPYASLCSEGECNGLKYHLKLLTVEYTNKPKLGIATTLSRDPFVPNVLASCSDATIILMDAIFYPNELFDIIFVLYKYFVKFRRIRH